MQQLLLTAETTSRSQVTRPKILLSHLRDVAESIKLSGSRAESLVYSTPRNNTGWTGFIFASDGHIALHHWDAATPPILQLDLVGFENSCITEAMAAIRDYWSLQNDIQLLIHRGCSPIKVLLHTDAGAELRRRTGTGPSSHTHILVDCSIPANFSVRQISIKSTELLRSLVPRMGMRAITDCQSIASNDSDAFHSSIIGITTSHICARAVRRGEEYTLHLDAFSCREIDPALIVRAISDKFGPTRAHLSVYVRYPVISFTSFTC